MVLFDHEVVYRRDMEKTKEKNAVYIEFVIAFEANFGRQPIRFVDLIEQEFTLLIDFAFGLPSSYADHYLKRNLW